MQAGFPLGLVHPLIFDGTLLVAGRVILKEPIDDIILNPGLLHDNCRVHGDLL